MVQDILYTLSLAVVMTLCLLGLWCKDFKENFLQNCGLAVMGAGCAIRLSAIAISEPSATESTRYMVVYGLALYGLGTALKVWKYRSASHGNNTTTSTQ